MSNNNSGKVEELKEKLAAIEHERWSDWQKWVHDCLLTISIPNGVLPGKRTVNHLPDEIKKRWERQIATPYSELSDKEKASDMEQVDRYWKLIEDFYYQLMLSLVPKKDERMFPGIDSPLPDGAVRETCYKQGRNEAIDELVAKLSEHFNEEGGI